jgi:hypothetical protein
MSIPDLLVKWRKKSRVGNATAGICADELEAALKAEPAPPSDALHDERKDWYGAPGTANGPRFAECVAGPFSAGDSIAAVAEWYDISQADVVLAIRDTLKTYKRVIDGIGAVFEAHDERVMLCGNDDKWRSLATDPPMQRTLFVNDPKPGGVK